MARTLNPFRESPLEVDGWKLYWIGIDWAADTLELDYRRAGVLERLFFSRKDIFMCATGEGLAGQIVNRLMYGPR